MSSPSAVVCREVFDENSQPSVEEICEYAQQLGIDPESESHLLPLARDGLMQALPHQWKAYYDEKLQTHYYYNEETKNTQWEHPLDNLYRELVKKARDASMQDDTCASVQELPTSEENTNQRNLERHETKVESDEELSTDSENQPEVKENTIHNKRLTPLGRPPLSPLTKLDKKLGDIHISPLRRSIEAVPKSKLVHHTSDKDVFDRMPFEKHKIMFKQHSENIDLKMNVQSPEEENVKLLFGSKTDKGLPLTGKGNMFLKLSKSDLPSPETEKSLPLDSVTKSDPPKGILRESISDIINRRPDNVGRQTASFDEDKKCVRFQLEDAAESAASPGSNSSSEQNEPQSSVVSARPPLPPRPAKPSSDKDSTGSATATAGSEVASGPGRRVVRPPPTDYIRPQLFQKHFRKIADILADPAPDPAPDLAPDGSRPRSPMVPLTNKISINLMESIESETSIDSPDREFVNLDLNDLNDANELNDLDDSNEQKDRSVSKDDSDRDSGMLRSPPAERAGRGLPACSDELRDTSEPDRYQPSNEGLAKNKSSSETSAAPPAPPVPSPAPNSARDIKPLKYDFAKPWTPLSSFQPQKAVIAPQVKTSESSSSLKVASPRLDGVILSNGNTRSDNVVVVYQFETQQNSLSKPLRSPLIPDMGTRDFIERHKSDERRRLELALQKELESIRVEWSLREKKLRAELNEELRESEERFVAEKRVRLNEQAERHRRELEETLASNERQHRAALEAARAQLEARRTADVDAAENEHARDMERLKETYRDKRDQLRRMLEAEHEQCLEEVRDQFASQVERERARLRNEQRSAVLCAREQHRAALDALRQDYRAQVERVRGEHRCLAEEARRRLAAQRQPAPDKYRALKDKYTRLKHDVKMSIERRNKRREASATTGSETDPSASHRTARSADRSRGGRPRTDDEPGNRNSTSASDGPAPRSAAVPGPCATFPMESQSRRQHLPAAPPPRAAASPPRAAPRPHAARETPTDPQDSSDAGSAGGRAPSGRGRRRSFARLKSASTSRLHCSPRWAGPLESVRQQLRALDALDALGSPDQPAYALPYPFRAGEAARPELEFVRHRALVEREGVRRARGVLRARRAALLQEGREGREEEERTELEVSLHRARAVLGEKEIRLRHIERTLAALAAPPAAPPAGTPLQNGTTTYGCSARDDSASDASSPFDDVTPPGDVTPPAGPPGSSSCRAAPAPRARSPEGASPRARRLRAWLHSPP
ncbi:centrosomal protein of 164 kDa isoform X2 [Bombyx mandarina]|uniref:Centrosomal protein of 164 kDa isoform X2 n=1 Tax=Bombyx mandarina TaxID=7092 RepID=A0A6J2KKS6_BOMMA|nr:centrosomal protein of 164 kDa isoform X2 [Bombyx mandarina]